MAKWTKEEDELLLKLINEGAGNSELYQYFPNRGKPAINSRASRIRSGKPLEYIKGELKGKMIGKLEVGDIVGTEIDEKNHHVHKIYECICHCDDTHTNITYVREGNLITYNTTSCGCNKVMLSDQNPNRSFNEYHTWEDIAFVKFTNCNEYFLCDAVFWNDFGCKYGWSKTVLGYAEARINYKLLLMHQIILEVPEGYVVDHHFRVSQGLLDNRISNLRIVTQYINMHNIGLKSHNTSGYTCVAVDKRSERWYSEIVVKKKKYFLGYFDNKVDAIKARLQAEHDLLGIYAPQKHLFAEFGIDDADLELYGSDFIEDELPKKYGYQRLLVPTPEDIKQYSN